MKMSVLFHFTKNVLELRKYLSVSKFDNWPSIIQFERLKIELIYFIYLFFIYLSAILNCNSTLKKQLWHNYRD